MAKQNQSNEKESAPVNKYMSNGVVTAEGLRQYAEISNRMKTRPELEKVMMGENWDKIGAWVLFLILEHLEKK